MQSATNIIGTTKATRRPSGETREVSWASVAQSRANFDDGSRAERSPSDEARASRRFKGLGLGSTWTGVFGRSALRRATAAPMSRALLREPFAGSSNQTCRVAAGTLPSSNRRLLLLSHCVTARSDGPPSPKPSQVTEPGFRIGRRELPASSARRAATPATDAAVMAPEL